MANEIAPNTTESIQFLKRFSPNGPWSLSAIDVAQTGIATAVFYPSQVDDCTRWIEARNGRENLYFQINPPNQGVQKRPTKSDIARVEWLHVDIDPREGVSLDDERSRILRLLEADRPEGIPEPTLIIDSGGGYWGLWRLETPVVMSDAGTIVEVERYNRSLEQAFQADTCHNIDRLCRLPGTVNIPSPKKAKRGRSLSIAAVHRFHTTTFPLRAFVPAPVVGVDFAMAPSGRVHVSPGTQKLLEIDELDAWQVPDRIRVICVQGFHPEEAPKPRDNSRSAWLFDAVCGLVRAGVPDEVVYSILTNPEFAVSESILEKGKKAHIYAIRQIERAQEEAIGPELRELNERHAVIQNVGGACKVATFSKDPSGRPLISFQSFNDIRNAYMNRRVGDLSSQKPPQKLGDFWLNHERRRTYREIVFDPTDRSPPDVLNLWTGFGVEPRQGDWSLMQRHIREVIASGNDGDAKYVMKWLAWAVQHPDLPAEVALVLLGGKGTGKGTLVQAMMTIFGHHALQISNPDLLVGRFNGHLRNVCLLFADEAYWPGNKKYEGTLKALITEPQIAIEAKGLDAVPALNRLHIIMASNEQWVVPAGEEERRYAVLDLSPERQQDHAYFNELRTQMKRGGTEAMLHDLLRMDLGDWHPRQDIPQTKALARQFEENLHGHEKAVFDMLMTGELPSFAGSLDGGRYFLPTTAFTELINKHHRTSVSGTKVGELLGKGRGANGRGLGFESTRVAEVRGFVIPPLPTARLAWERARFAPEWATADSWAKPGMGAQTSAF